MFPHFANVWVPLGLVRDVPAGRPVPHVVAGERVVLFRDADGQVRALVDRCPHRGVALSLGRVDGGQIVCPFHGWRFDGAGHCRHVPWNPDARLHTLSATGLPLREAGGLIWLFTGQNPVGAPQLPDVLGRDDVRVMAQSFVWAAHWTRVMENMLDTPHLPFVHARTIGRSLRGRTAEKMTMVWDDTDFGAQVTAVRGDEPPRAVLRYYFPNMMELAIDPGGRIMRLLAVCTPAEAGTTRLTIYTVRNFFRARLFDPLFARSNARIAAEDQAIVESARPSQVPPPAEERSVASDAPTLAFRRIWLNRIMALGDQGIPNLAPVPDPAHAASATAGD
ncbi:aromatic ring-hydroxylating dioxygenase subunit alpha [Novosphingobium sp.]|uniref:aromatic ring-hydroxylating dioxygenase subunit alpha n=1 Tax=Novosphingobium sp. TaxID=1874826 RepID=UPI0033415C72